VTVNRPDGLTVVNDEGVVSVPTSTGRPIFLAMTNA
jgi:hypothetical protein